MEVCQQLRVDLGFVEVGCVLVEIGGKRCGWDIGCVVDILAWLCFWDVDVFVGLCLALEVKGLLYFWGLLAVEGVIVVLLTCAEVIIFTTEVVVLN